MIILLLKLLTRCRQWLPDLGGLRDKKLRSYPNSPVYFKYFRLEIKIVEGGAFIKIVLFRGFTHKRSRFSNYGAI
jgi:hypothetical protein